MPRITFIAPSGVQRTFDGEVGQSVMEIAKRNGVEGIVGECGGSCACSTCHIYVDDAWRLAVGPPSPDEADMLDFAYDRRTTSRLACQIRLHPELDGLIVHTPERQSS
ncbi:2Fe-2S iron-sulfur cluster-binding protein [Sphingobium sp.]|uniref:2Fe-2S iron-sulfur cluster-binding protein n=1 Tax=Sphingobium sp. TaxID=1912891 RepID=UPI0028BF4FA9|nr:2Fe-2S iron-sulfur cluster-binding protein [Sphingobium sp.]